MGRCMHLLLAVIILVFAQVAATQANGKPQIHFMGVGRGDGAVLISPRR